MSIHICVPCRVEYWFRMRACCLCAYPRRPSPTVEAGKGTDTSPSNNAGDDGAGSTRTPILSSDAVEACLHTLLCMSSLQTMCTNHLRTALDDGLKAFPRNR